MLSPFAPFVFVVVGQFEFNIRDVPWYHTRTVEDGLLTNSTEERNNLKKDHAPTSSIILPLALAGLAVLVILIGCLGALFHFKKR